MDAISYKGIDEAALIHALYDAAYRPGTGDAWTPAAVQDIAQLMKGGVSVDDVRADIGEIKPDQKWIRIDYYRGRPLKVSLDLEAKEFRPHLFDRDAGQGAAKRVVDALLAKAA